MGDKSPKKKPMSIEEMREELKMGTTMRADRILKKMRKERKEISWLRNFRANQIDRLGEEKANIKRWEDRKKWLIPAVREIRKLDEGLAILPNVIRTKKKEHRVSTEIDHVESRELKKSYSRLLGEKSQLEGGIPILKKMDKLSKEKEKLKRVFEKKEGERGEIKERVDALEEEFNEIQAKMAKLIKQVQGGER